ncbi:MAG: hypothetical protein JNK38_28800 [Acidobacteria bacterium]|nr:hypothetical protein [Acidobacteriota bacterium]
MQEIVELRVDEDFASKLFADNEGEKLGSVRKILISTTDPRFPEIGRLQESLRRTINRPFFYGWDIRRSYNKKELVLASIFLLLINSLFEPAGEECGTQYDETSACPKCGSGAKQVTDLFLDLRRIPKKKDVAVTIAGEIVVSRRLVDLFLKYKIEGAEFLPVRQKNDPSSESKEWFQLSVKSMDAEITSPTIIRSTLFNDDKDQSRTDDPKKIVVGNYVQVLHPLDSERCPTGDLLGLNLISEVSLKRDSYNGEDIFSSKQFVGTRRGLIRPQRLIFISQKLWRVVEEERLKGERIKGVSFEVAHLV